MREVSVIVPSYNGALRLPVLLESLAKQSYSRFELIVIIDGSTDHSFRVVKDFEEKFQNLKIIEQSNKGRAGAKNSGAKVANGNILVFVDDDVRFNPETLENHLRHHQVVENSVLVGSIVEEELKKAHDIQKYRRSLSIKWQQGLGKSKSIIGESYLSSANFSISNLVFTHLGGFEEKLRDCEDHDLAVRARDNGIPIFFDPEIIGLHLDVVSAKRYLKRLKDYRKAYQNLYCLRGWDQKLHPHNVFKKSIYWGFSFSFWIFLMDANMLVWLPKKLRYKLYDAVFFSQSQVFPK